MVGESDWLDPKRAPKGKLIKSANDNPGPYGAAALR